jgi:hypothetical protein
MDPPTKRPGAKYCVVFRADEEVVIYGNAAGFSTLADWLAFLAASAPEDMGELHMNWHLNSLAEKQSGTLETVSFIDERGAPEARANAQSDPLEREVTFMLLPDEKLDELRREAKVGELPVQTDQETG